MQVVYGRYYTGGTGPLTHNGHETFPCPGSDCLAGPRIQEVSGLPPGTSAPSTVITEHAVRRLGLRAITSGWLIQTPHALTAAQISGARRTAAAAGMSVETRSSVPASAEITNWATAFGIVLALAILAMAVGLLRSETASDLRTLTATGAVPGPAAPSPPSPPAPSPCLARCSARRPAMSPASPGSGEAR
jgi:putative ABC transport system permease protein